MTFPLSAINNEGDYRHLGGDTQMRQNPGRLLEGRQPTSNNVEAQTAVVKLIFYGLSSKECKEVFPSHCVLDKRQNCTTYGKRVPGSIFAI